MVVLALRFSMLYCMLMLCTGRSQKQRMNMVGVTGKQVEETVTTELTEHVPIVEYLNAITYTCT